VPVQELVIYRPVYACRSRCREITCVCMYVWIIKDDEGHAEEKKLPVGRSEQHDSNERQYVCCHSLGRGVLIICFYSFNRGEKTNILNK